MAIGADDAGDCVTVTHAIPHLADGALIVLTNNDRFGRVWILHARQRKVGLLARETFIARRPPEIDPGWTPSTVANPAIWINPSGETQLARPFLVRISPPHFSFRPLVKIVIVRPRAPLVGFGKGPEGGWIVYRQPKDVLDRNLHDNEVDCKLHRPIGLPIHFHRQS